MATLLGINSTEEGIRNLELEYLDMLGDFDETHCFPHTLESEVRHEYAVNDIAQHVRTITLKSHLARQDKPAIPHTGVCQCKHNPKGLRICPVHKEGTIHYGSK